MNYLQMSPDSIYIFLVLVKWSIYHTYGSLWQASVLSQSLFCKIHTPFTPVISSRRFYWKISVQ